MHEQIEHASPGRQATAEVGSLELAEPEDDTARQARRQRNEEVLRKMDEWLADESGYDEETWPLLEAAFGDRKDKEYKPSCTT